LNDSVTAYSIAVALRNAIATELGIQSEELGCDSKPIQQMGQAASVIQVFDLGSGGYTSQAASRVNDPSLWHRVINNVDLHLPARLPEMFTRIRYPL
jgi:DEAD/DEAH box helicase domain-containing protein